MEKQKTLSSTLKPNLANNPLTPAHLSEVISFVVLRREADLVPLFISFISYCFVLFAFSFHTGVILLCSCSGQHFNASHSSLLPPPLEVLVELLRLDESLCHTGGAVIHSCVCSLDAVYLQSGGEHLRPEHEVFGGAERIFSA